MLAASPSAVSGSIFAVFVLAIRRQLLDLKDEIEDEGCLGTSLQGISGLVEARLGLGGCVPAYKSSSSSCNGFFFPLNPA